MDTLNTKPVKRFVGALAASAVLSFAAQHMPSKPSATEFSPLVSSAAVTLICAGIAARIGFGPGRGAFARVNN